MKRLVISLLTIILFTLFPKLSAQEIIRNSLVSSVCYAGNKVNRIFIPPPSDFYKNAGMKGGATIAVYYTGFTETAKAVVEHAVTILETILPDDTHVTVKATWIQLPSLNVLANSSSTAYLGGWGIDALNPFAYYPIALGEKISGKTYNKDEEGDIELTINSSANWYLGTDGNTPVSQYDLVTVVIHELIHGLGFVDSMVAEGLSGSYGVSSIPLIYDTFIENLAGKKLTDTLEFANPSSDLKKEIISEKLYFNSPLLSYYTQGLRSKIYAPSTFDSGSSISHLDEEVTAEINQLMTPYIDLGEAIHDPGKLTISILGDLGWINTRIIHEPLKDTEEHLSEITITATIKSDTLYNHDKVALVGSFNKSATWDTVYLVSPQSDDNFTATLTIPSYETSLEYYLYVEDQFSRIYRLPSYIDKNRYSVYVGTDTVKPVIDYIPYGYYLETIDTIKFEPKVTDNIGIDTVYIEYKVNDGTLQFLGLKPDGKGNYRNALIAKTLSLTGGDYLQYRIIAIDKAATPNQKVFPAVGYHTADIENVNPVDIAYATNFTDAYDDFLEEGITIRRPQGFTHFGLHTPHPYISPEETGDSLGYVALLRTPVKFDANGMIIGYQELVLVEPGEAGSVFGSEDFYDYVIVEGSGDFGKTWFPLADGYDSRIIKSWETSYNSAIDGYNSTFVGDESMMIKHTIFPKVSEFISAGDTLMIRFRLFSDPYSNGWGWAIQDLHIGPLIDNVEDIIYQPLIIYPNPGNGLITIKQTGESVLNRTRYSVFNSAGICIITDNANTDGGEEINIDISHHPSGLYMIVLFRDDDIMTLKYNLIK